MHTPQIVQILKDSDYTLTLFSQDSIQNLEAKIIAKVQTPSHAKPAQRERERERNPRTKQPRIHASQ